jgi:acyl-CoA oxidase
MVLLQLVAKGLLTRYQQGFNDLDPLALVRFAASQAVETVVERAALRQIVERLKDVGSNKDDDADLLDVRYHAALLRWREEHIRSSLARRLKRGVDEGRPAFDVFAECQDHALALARANVERVVHAAFVAGVERADEQLRPPLLQLVELHGLATIEADRAWFIEHGRLSTERSKAITAMVGRLCALVAPDAEALTDAFAIPDELLRAPIALSLRAPRATP